MKKTTLLSCLVLLLALATGLPALAANTTTTVAQVASAVTLTDDVDYVVTGATPFADNGVVDIQNTDHAVLIIQAKKPSAVIPLLAGHVLIAGEQAVNGQNCQVKIYNRGAIVLPYGNSTKPLTVYSEQNFQGTAVNDFGLEHAGGMMNTLTTAKLNNQIRSFRLKRGYMVTFSTLANGRGYSRCFIAAYSDLEMATLPAVLDQKITSYRIFKWYDASKAGIANTTDRTTVNAVNAQSCYSFGLGEDRGPDAECVPHHIYEDWPSPSACGSVTYSPHLKTNNEPRNQADDHPQDLATILANWENLMATGMRLCTPSSWDGSDYWNATGFVKTFLDSIDARGWRCDIIDVHAYWNEGSFSNLNNWYSAMGQRPIWISEWIWGASWSGGSGIFSVATTADQRNNPTAAILNQNNTVVTRILNNLNAWDYVERYFYWNSEANCSKLYYNGQLTPTGQTYATMTTKPGFANRQHVPKAPVQRAPGSFSVDYDKNTHKALLRWYDANGEYNRSMTVERKVPGEDWEVVYTPTQRETALSYTYTDEASLDGYRYRVHIVDLNGQDRYSSEASSVIEDVATGDPITVGSKQMYLGGNVIVNGDFDLGLTGWTNSRGNPIGAPNFQVATYESTDGGPYLISWTSLGLNSVGELRTLFDVEPQHNYYFSFMVRNGGGAYQQVYATEGGLATDSAVFQSQATTGWQMQAGTFSTGHFDKVAVVGRWMDRTRMDKFALCRLFDTREEAFADALAQTLRQAQAIIAYNTALPAINAELAALAPAEGDAEQAYNSAQIAVQNALNCLRKQAELQNLLERAQSFLQLGLPGSDQLAQLVADAQTATTATQLLHVGQDLQQALDALPAFLAVSGVSNPSFGAGASGWTTKAGTYQGGDQRQNTVLGKTCWNAWWGVQNANGQTLAVKQTVQNLSEGLYYLGCKATTEHYCLSDQHAFLQDEEGQKVQSPVLAYDRFDFPDMSNADAWQQLLTTPIYVPEGGSLVVGFESSKQGAVSGAWVKAGGGADAAPDYREGWWCATDFQLYQLPMYRRTTPQGGVWGTVTLSRAYQPGPGVQLYEVAGLLQEDGQEYVCLSPLTAQEAATPCVYYSETEQANFFTSGDAEDTPVKGPNGLYGRFANDYRVTTIPSTNVGSLVLVDGKWYELERTDLPYTLPRCQAFIQAGRSAMTQLPAWDGAKLPIAGTLTSAIAPVTTAADAPASYYNLSGRKAANGRHGLLIRKQDGRTIKMVGTH